MTNFLLEHGVLVVILANLFVIGSIVGSFLNVAIARLPWEKSIFWPMGSRCGTCHQPVRWYDNLPLISYWLLRGRCRTCKTPFSMRYFWVEMLVGIGLPLLFYLEVYRNIHGIPAFDQVPAQLRQNLFSAANLTPLIFFLQRACLFCLLVAAAFCDLQEREIPLSITLTGTAIGLIFAVCLPWPWPNAVGVSLPNPRSPMEEWWMLLPNEMQKIGLYLWPIWGPTPGWLAPGSWKLGLATGVAGALCGTFMLRSVKFLFERGFGREALGMGDADLMMMIGAFLGWQAVVVTFLAGGMVSLFLALPRLALGGSNEITFGPGLALGAILTWLGWSVIGPYVQAILFNPTILLLFVTGCAGILLVMSFIFGRIRRPA